MAGDSGLDPPRDRTLSVNSRERSAALDSWFWPACFVVACAPAAPDPVEIPDGPRVTASSVAPALSASSTPREELGLAELRARYRPPLLSRDGRHALVPAVDDGNDPTRYAYRAVVLEVATQGRRAVDVVDPEDDAVTSRQQLRAAAQILSATEWSGLSPLTTRPDPQAPVTPIHGLGGPYQSKLAQGEGLSVRFIYPKLVVIDQKTGRALRSDQPGWALTTTNSRCSPPLTLLDAAYVDESETHLLVVLAHGGSSPACPVADPTYHVVPLERP